MVAFFERKEDDKVSNILGALQLMLAVSIFQMLCVAEFPLEDADQTFRSENRLEKEEMREMRGYCIIIWIIGCKKM